MSWPSVLEPRRIFIKYGELFLRLFSDSWQWRRIRRLCKGGNHLGWKKYRRLFRRKWYFSLGRGRKWYRRRRKRCREWNRPFLDFAFFKELLVQKQILGSQRNLKCNETNIWRSTNIFTSTTRIRSYGSSARRSKSWQTPSAQATSEETFEKEYFPNREMKLNRCVYCASKGTRKRSTWGCMLCKVCLCVARFEPNRIQ